MTLEMKFQEREREAVATATLAAREEGMQQGALQKALELATNFKNMGFPLEKIAKATGLSLAEIEAL